MSKDRFFKRYSYIINIVKRKNINTETLTRNILSNFDDLNTYSTRTLSRDIKDIQSIFGIEIVFNRKKGGYEIVNEYQLEDDIEKQKQLEAFQYVELANFAKENQDILLFEQRKLSGFENISILLEAIKNLKIIKFEYTKFNDNVTSKRIIKPLALHEHNSRWYLLAEDTKDDIKKSFGLERIFNIEVLEENFVYPEDFSAKKHFENYFGLGMKISQVPELVHLSFNPVAAKYIETLPIHQSQKEIKRTKNEVVFEYELYINKDLVREILNYGNGVKVLKPKMLKNELLNVLKNTLQQYES